MLDFVLNFPVFYHCVVKDNTSLPQYDAVSVLLLGKQRFECVDVIEIKDSDAANYVSGKKAIKHQIIREILQSERSELVRRIESLGFQDVDKLACHLKQFINSLSTLSVNKRQNLFSLGEQEDAATFLSVVFLEAIKCPRKEIQKLSATEKKAIQSFFQSTEIVDSTPQKSEKLPPKKTAESNSNREESENPSILAWMKGSSSDYDASLLDTMMKVSSSDYDASLLDTIRKKLEYGYHIYYSIDALLETTNIIMSSGVSALSSLFKVPIKAGFSSFRFHDNIESIPEQRSMTNNTTISMYKFYISPQLTGHIILSMPNRFIENTFVIHKRECNVTFQIAADENAYKESMYNEFGSIFIGAALTALSDLLDTRILMQQSNLSLLSEETSITPPIFLSTLPFQSVQYSFISYLLLDSKSASDLLLLLTKIGKH